MKGGCTCKPTEQAQCRIARTRRRRSVTEVNSGSSPGAFEYSSTNAQVTSLGKSPLFPPTRIGNVLITSVTFVTSLGARPASIAKADAVVSFDVRYGYPDPCNSDRPNPCVPSTITCLPPSNAVCSRDATISTVAASPIRRLCSIKRTLSPRRSRRAAADPVPEPVLPIALARDDSFLRSSGSTNTARGSTINRLRSTRSHSISSNRRSSSTTHPAAIAKCDVRLRRGRRQLPEHNLLVVDPNGVARIWTAAPHDPRFRHFGCRQCSYFAFSLRAILTSDYNRCWHYLSYRIGLSVHFLISEQRSIRFSTLKPEPSTPTNATIVSRTDYLLFRPSMPAICLRGCIPHELRVLQQLSLRPSQWARSDPLSSVALAASYEWLQRRVANSLGTVLIMAKRRSDVI